MFSAYVKAAAPRVDYTPAPDSFDGTSHDEAYEIDFRGPTCTPGNDCLIAAHVAETTGGSTSADTTIVGCLAPQVLSGNGQLSRRVGDAGNGLTFVGSDPTSRIDHIAVTCTRGTLGTVARMVCQESRGGAEVFYPTFDVFCPGTPAPRFSSEPIAGTTFTLAAPLNGHAQATLLVRNDGDADLTVDPAVLPPGSISTTPATQTIPPNGSASFLVKCDPTDPAQTEDHRDLDLATNDAGKVAHFDVNCANNTPPATAAHFLARSPDRIVTRSPASSTGTLTVTNIGDAALTATPVAPSAPFSISAASGPIAPGASFDFNVTCSGANAGTFTDAIAFSTNDPTPNQSVGVSCTVDPALAPVYTSNPPPSGALLMSTQQGTNAFASLLVINAGNAPLDVDSVALQNVSPPGSLSVAPGSALAIARGDGRNFTVTCDASTAGNRSATLVVTSSDPNVPNAQYDVQCGVTAQVTPTPHLAVSPLGTVTIATSVNVTGAATVLLRNLGTANLVISGVGATTTAAITRSAVSTPATIVPNGAPLSITVSCNTATPGPHTDSFTITSNDPDVGAGRVVPITCNVAGTAPAPQFASSPAAPGPLTIATAQGANGNTALTVRNTGNAPLTVNASITGGATPIGVAPVSSSVPPGGAQTLALACAAATAGNFDRQLVVQTNAAGAASVSYTVHCAVAPTAPPPVRFAPQLVFAAHAAPRGVASADFNGDGKPDLVVANRTAGNVSVLLGYGTGNFRPQAEYVVPGAGNVAIGDFNHDNRPDLVVTNQLGGSNVSVLLGNANGTFQGAAPVTTGAQAFGVAVGFFNADANLDIAVTNFAGNSVSVLLGNGDGTFQNQATYSVGTNPVAIAVGDLNGDHVADLVVANYASSTVSVLLGNAGGNGTFQLQAGAPTVPSGPYGVAIADFDGDGALDVAVPASGANVASVLRGKGDGTFYAQASYAVGLAPFNIATGDFNRDGRADLAVTNATGQTVSILLGTGTGTFLPQQIFQGNGGPYGIAVADLNLDGAPDLAFANNGTDNVSVLLNGAGQFGPQALYPLEAGPRGGVAADFNGDHKLDLAFANRDSATVSVLLGRGDGTFQGQVPVSVGAGNGAGAVAMGDFNGDGSVDLAVAEFFAVSGVSHVSILLNNGSGLFSLVLPKAPVGNGPSSIVVARFDGDAHDDIATANYNSNNASVLLGDGAGAFSPAPPIMTGLNSGGIAVGRFDAGTTDDLLVANSGANTVSVLLGNGAGGFAAGPGSPLATPAGGPISIAPGDFNRDGATDFAVSILNANKIAVMLGNGSGGFSAIVDPLSPYVVASNPNWVSSVDIDGDGKLDLLVSSAGASLLSVLYGNGDGTFQPPIKYPMGGGAFGVVTGDFNGDGSPDVAVSNNGGNSLSVRLNTTANYGVVFRDGFE